MCIDIHIISVHSYINKINKTRKVFHMYNVVSITACKYILLYIVKTISLSCLDISTMFSAVLSY